MTELERALDQIADIRQHVAEAKLFQGFGPLVISVTGCLALLLGFLQSDAIGVGPAFLWAWVWLGVASFGLIAFEMCALSNRAHGANTAALLWAMVEKFLPSFFAGAGVGWIILFQSQETYWVLPGLWQILIAIALFAARPMLPKATVGVAAWYLLTGLVCLLIASQTHSAGPLAMAIPFGVGQLLMAASLKWPFQKR